MKKKRTSATWTDPEIRVLLDHYEQKGPDFCAQVLQAKGFPRSAVAALTKGRKIGLRYKGPAIGRFIQGQVPPNKGRKMSPEVYEKTKRTMFKPGARPENRVPIGHETMRGDGYTYVKIAEKTWKFKHVLIWEAHHGPVPAAHIIVFRDGNPNNFNLDNLECITRKEHVYRNRHGAGPSSYSLLSGRAAKMRLRKRGIPAKAIRQNPEILEMSKAETLLKLKKRTQCHATHTQK